MQQAVAVPVGVLAGLAVLMFIFMFWWFPRHWQKGVRMDMAEVDARKREREQFAMDHGQLEAQNGAGMVNVDGKVPVMPKAYIAPVTPY